MSVKDLRSFIGRMDGRRGADAAAIGAAATIVKGLAAANACDGEPIEQRHEQLRELEPARVGAAPQLRAGVRVVGRRRME